MYFDVSNNIIITNILVIIIIGIVEVIIFLLLYLSSDTSLDIDIGRLSPVIVIASENVGSINEYRLIPSIPIILVVIIFIKRPNTLVIRPPIISIIVDLIKFSFILDFM